MMSLVVLITTSRYIYATTIENLIVIDPGHGGTDGGSVGSDGTKEKDVNLEVAFILKEILEEKGFSVILTRYTDQDLASSTNNTNRKREDIHKRVKIINESGARLYLSIHANSYPSQKVRGAQVFYKEGDDTSKILGIILQKSLNDNLKNTNRVAKTINDKYLVDNVKIPGVLIEVGFLSNLEELELLKKHEYKKMLSNAIYQGVINYLNFKTN